MFSIAKFIFSTSPAISEGGNARALIRDPETGLVTGPEQVKSFRGRQAYAEKIDLRAGRIKRQDFRRDVIEMLKALDNKFKSDHGVTLWDPEQRDEVLGAGFAFNGSSAHLFAPPETLPDEEFVKYKPVVGDIDLTVPNEKLGELFSTLNRLEEQQLTSRITYVGHNKKSPRGLDQINALFAYTWDPAAPSGEGDTFFQIDFEGSEYESGRPTQWARFSHSSSWRDIEAGVKGLAHKILLFSIAYVRSPPPIDARIATPTATAENPRISMTKDKKFVPPTPAEIEKKIQDRAAQIELQQTRRNPESARKKAEAEIKAEISAAEKRPASLGSMKSLDLVVGYAERYKKLDWQHNGNEVYRYLKRAERDTAVRDIEKIFTGIFGSEPPPTKKDLDDFESFTGTLNIMKNRMSPPEIVRIYEEMVYRFFGSGAQRISATDKQEDMEVKDKILEVFRRVLPEAEASTVDIAEMRSNFYAKYKVRGEEGFTEDDTFFGDVDESRNHLKHLAKSIIWEI
jgi:hypothetical protein